VANKWLMLVPYLIQLFLFWLWSNFLLTAHAKSMAETAVTGEYNMVTYNNNYTCAFFLICISLYKVVLEIIQFKGGLNIAREHGHGCCKFWKNPYVRDVKNWIEIVGTLIIIRNCLASSFGKSFSSF